MEYRTEYMSKIKKNPETMKVRIIKSHRTYTWYATRVGEIFNVYKEIHDNKYYMKAPYDSQGIVTDDAEIVNTFKDEISDILDLNK